ncbi:unnamed protein product [Nyctereutes procyonoides]|uniref:(raccoon dog) hypothetical protein n=1 Tax=Nyctereutes procyonoides TaxID=34880 RepID=A0A811Z1Z3_NYCPR|nr:unnamed protein product [Nyctereutes procyonoides]
MYTPRKNVWVEVCPACDTRLQGHRYEATVAWGHADHDQWAQWLLLGQTGEECRVVSEPRRVSRLGPCCTQSFPGACGQGCGCVHVCTGHRLQEGGPFLQEWVREGVPGSEVTSVSQSPMELGTPVTRHPHPVQPQLRLTWLETSATGRCSLAAFPPLGALAPRNPRGAACSNAVGIGSSIDANVQAGSLSGRGSPSSSSPLGPQRRACQGGIPGLPAAPCRLHVPSVPPQGAGASAGKGHQIAPTKSSRTELLEHEARQLMLALLRRDVISIYKFLDDYRGFATTDEVLDLLFTEYGCTIAASGDDVAVLQHWKLAITCMLEIWLGHYRDDFCQLPEFPSLMKLLRFLRQNMPGSDMELRALRCLRQFRRLHAAKPEAGASARGNHPEPALERAPATTVGPTAPSGPGEFEAILAAESEGSARAEVPAGEAKPLQIVVTALVHCSALEEPPAPLGALEEEQAPAPALEVVDVPEPPRISMEQPASGPENPLEPPEEPAPAPNVEPGEGSGSEVILDSGDEDLLKAEMLAPEVKVVHELVEPMVPCPNEEEPPAPAATPEE